MMITQALPTARRYGIAVVTVALFMGLAATTDGFLSQANFRNILDQQSALLIAASFATITMISGGFDISAASVYVVAPLFALQVENSTGNVVLAVAVGLVVGMTNGLVVTVLKVNSFIATLATSFMVFGAGFLVSDRSVLRASTDAWPSIARTRWWGITTGAWLAAAVVAVAWILLSRTRFGRHVYAVGGNAEAARLAGVPVARVKTICFAMAGASAGLAGVVSSSRSLSALPSDDFSFVFGVIAAVVVGGTSIAGGEGAVWRTIAGAFFIALMINGFNLHQIDPIWQRVIQGAVILAAVSVDSWSQRRAR